MLLFLATLVTASRLADPGSPLLNGNYGADLIPSYMAGCFVREGRPDKLMNFAEASRFQAHLRRVWRLEQNGRTGPWLNPPYYAWLFVPLSALPYPEARAAWLVFNLLMAGASMVLLGRMCVFVPSPLYSGKFLSPSPLYSGKFLSPSPLYSGERAGVRGPFCSSLLGRWTFNWRSEEHTEPPTLNVQRPTSNEGRGIPSPRPSPLSTGERERILPIPREPIPRGIRVWGLIPLLMVTSMPFIQAMASQQNTFLSLLLLTGTAWFWRRGQGLRAGLVAGLLLFKPQLAAVVAAALCCSLGRRALLGLAATASALLVATVLVMPGALADYLDKLPSVLPWLKSGGHYAWERQVTFQGFWRLLIQGPVSGPAPAVARLLWPGCAVAAGAMLVPAFIRAWRTRPAPGASHDRLIAATVAMTPLLMPYYMDYDLLLLAVPAVLLAAEWRRSAGPPDWTSRLLLRGWVLLFPLLFLNAAFAEATRVSLTVPLLAGMAGLYAWRAARPAVAQGAIRLQMPQRPEFPVPQGQPAAA